MASLHQECTRYELLVPCTLCLATTLYRSGFVGEVHPFPRSYMFPPEPSLGLPVPATNVRGDEGGGGGAVLIVRIEESIDLAVHASRSTNTNR